MIVCKNIVNSKLLLMRNYATKNVLNSLLIKNYKYSITK